MEFSSSLRLYPSLPLPSHPSSSSEFDFSSSSEAAALPSTLDNFPSKNGGSSSLPLPTTAPTTSSILPFLNPFTSRQKKSPSPSPSSAPSSPSLFGLHYSYSTYRPRFPYILASFSCPSTLSSSTSELPSESKQFQASYDKSYKSSLPLLPSTLSSQSGPSDHHRLQATNAFVSSVSNLEDCGKKDILSSSTNPEDFASLVSDISELPTSCSYKCSRLSSSHNLNIFHPVESAPPHCYSQQQLCICRYHLQQYHQQHCSCGCRSSASRKECPSFSVPICSQPHHHSGQQFSSLAASSKVCLANSQNSTHPSCLGVVLSSAVINSSSSSPPVKKTSPSCSSVESSSSGNAENVNEFFRFQNNYLNVPAEKSSELLNHQNHQCSPLPALSSSSASHCPHHVSHSHHCLCPLHYHHYHHHHHHHHPCSNGRQRMFRHHYIQQCNPSSSSSLHSTMDSRHVCNGCITTAPLEHYYRPTPLPPFPPISSNKSLAVSALHCKALPTFNICASNGRGGFSRNGERSSVRDVSNSNKNVCFRNVMTEVASKLELSEVLDGYEDVAYEGIRDLVAQNVQHRDVRLLCDQHCLSPLEDVKYSEQSKFSSVSTEEGPSTDGSSSMIIPLSQTLSKSCSGAAPTRSYSMTRTYFNMNERQTRNADCSIGRGKVKSNSESTVGKPFVVFVTNSEETLGPATFYSSSSSDSYRQGSMGLLASHIGDGEEGKEEVDLANASSTSTSFCTAESCENENDDGKNVCRNGKGTVFPASGEEEEEEEDEEIMMRSRCIKMEEHNTLGSSVLGVASETLPIISAATNSYDCSMTSETFSEEEGMTGIFVVENASFTAAVPATARIENFQSDRRSVGRVVGGPPLYSGDAHREEDIPLYVDSKTLVDFSKMTNLSMQAYMTMEHNSYNEALCMARLMVGKWETLLTRSDPLDPLFKNFGIAYIKRVIVDKLSIPLTILLEDCEVWLHVVVHLPVGNRHMRWHLDGMKSEEEDPDCGVWVGQTRCIVLTLPWVENGKPFRALQQYRTHSKIGVVYETRAVLPDPKYSRILYLNYM